MELMKKYFLSALALSALFVACSNEEEVATTTEKSPVNFVLDKQVGRTVTNGNTTTFVEGDQIGITSSGLDIDMSNATYTVGADGSLSGGSFYYNGNNKATFYAHYPTTATITDGVVSMNVPANQATETAFNACDFMTSTATGDPANGGTVVLKFKHRLAMVKVVWNGSATATNVMLHGAKPTVKWTQATDATATDGNAIDINMWKIDEGQEYWAMIPEQTLTTAYKLLTITDADKSYEYTPAGNLTFSANTIKKITLNLTEEGNVEATISDIDITNWEEDVNDGGGYVEEVQLPAVEIITVEAGKNIALTLNSKNNAVESAWNVAVAEGNTIEIDSEKALHLNIDTIGGVDGKWWNNAVYYRPSAEVAAKIKPAIYKLTFKAKADAALKGFMVQVMKGDESANTYFGIFNADPATKDEVTWARMYYPSFKADLFNEGVMEYQEMTYWVNFGKILDTAGTTVTDAKVGDYEKVLLTLSVNTGTSDANAYGVDFWFKDFTFIEVK